MVISKLFSYFLKWEVLVIDLKLYRYYDLKYKEVNQYQHKRALALTARKLVRLVFRLLKDNRLYKRPEG